MSHQKKKKNKPFQSDNFLCYNALYHFLRCLYECPSMLTLHLFSIFSRSWHLTSPSQGFLASMSRCLPLMSRLALMSHGLWTSMSRSLALMSATRFLTGEWVGDDWVSVSTSLNTTWAPPPTVGSTSAWKQVKKKNK